jgi:hypothetical protein
MIASRRERNLNFIAWPVVEEEHGHERFTPCRPLESNHVIKNASWMPEQKVAMPSGQPNLADEEIRLGHIKRFVSMQELIDDLDQPE